MDASVVNAVLAASLLLLYYGKRTAAVLLQLPSDADLWYRCRATAAAQLVIDAACLVLR